VLHHVSDRRHDQQTIKQQDEKRKFLTKFLYLFVVVGGGELHLPVCDPAADPGGDGAG
jgi:hypothetical protein